ncbi:MAG: chorismate synthase [Bacteroidaceae bacterium]|nr:chorismate synthase [Bacteroidaceae bacterium]
MNTFGNLLCLTTFGESHGSAIGGVIDGFPSGITVDMDFIQSELRRRRPGQSHLTTARKEDDEVEILSGVYEGKTLGTPIGFLVRNSDQHSGDYDEMKDTFRPSHADFTYYAKYGIRDHRGGGRSSARETISRVVGGAFAKLFLRQVGITVQAYTSQVGDIATNKHYPELDLSKTESNPVRCPDEDVAPRMQKLIEAVKADGDTVGGIITCVVRGCPVGLGEPVFGKLHAALAAAMLSINAAKGFDYGAGFSGVTMRGSEQNDLFTTDENGHITTETNHSGGIQGGISNGQDIYFRVAFKPVATLLKSQETVNIHGKQVTLKARGRHDPCVLPRAVPVVEAMTAMTIMDYYLLNQSTNR